MKSYNIQNYIRYKEDIKQAMSRIDGKFWDEYTRDELIIKFLPLVENIAKKFSTTTQASGVLDITDLIQAGSKGLIMAIDKIEWTTITDSDDPEKTIKSFLSKRIKGSIRRDMDIYRGSIKLPEHKLIEMRKDNGQNQDMVAMFFNSIFLSLDEDFDSSDDNFFDGTTSFESGIFEDKSKEYNIDLLNIYLLGLFKKYLTHTESEVLRLSYGLDCDKHSAITIAELLNIEGNSAYVRVSELKKQAIKKLIDNVDHSQVLDYL
jgi:DNA-directed RNA polymerase specialized sigma subunit